MKTLFRLTQKGPWNTDGLDVQWKIQNNYLILKGSNSKEDWRNNFDIWVTPYKQSRWRAHRGFVRMWKSVRRKILASIEPATIKGVVGFSLGAALGVLAHEDIENTLDIKIHSHLFGGPPVLWFPSKKIKAKFSRVQLHSVRGDIVHDFPLWLLGFKHVGVQRRYGPFALIPSAKRHYPGQYLKYLPNKES